MTSEEECLYALREAAERLEKSPTKTEYENLELTPASTTIRRIVGGWNEAKKRAGLETYSQDDNGGMDIQPKPEDLALPDDKEWSHLTPQQRRYLKNRDHRITVKDRRRNELRRWFFDVKRDELRCTRCGEQRPAALDFHHQDEKTGGVSKMVNDGYSKARIREEIDRCLVLCANCHREEHDVSTDPEILPTLDEIEEQIRYSSRPELRQKRREWIAAYKRNNGGCTRCSVENPICLDFHHQDEKFREIVKMVSRRMGMDKIRREIKKCELLCANCHRHVHSDQPASNRETHRR